MWIEPTPMKAQRKTRSKKNFRGFSHHFPSCLQGLQGQWGLGLFCFILFYIHRMSTFSHLHSLCRTPYLLKYKSGCSLDKEKQVYMCVRHMGKMLISSPSSSTISYPFTQTQANLYCLIYGTMDHGQKLVIQVQERMPTQETKEKEHGILTTL